MNLHDISPYVRYAARSVLCAPFQIGQRVILDYELIFIESGEFLLSYDGTDYACKRGDVLLFRPGYRHTMKSLGDVSISQPHIHFDMTYDDHSENDVFISFKDLPDFSPAEQLLIRPDFFAGAEVGPILSVTDPDRLKSCLFAVIDLYSQQPALYPLLVKQRMLELLELVLNDNTSVEHTAAPPERNLPQMIRSFIDYQFYNRISLNSLEKQFHYSKFYISRGFTQHVGIPVIQYYNQKRLEYAKKQILSGQCVTKIAQDLHFTSIYAFSRFFKSHTGCSPTEYRRAGG